MNKCKWCGNKIIPVRKGHKLFCNRICAVIFNQKKCSKKEYKKLFWVNCITCEKLFDRKYLNVKIFYCSPICKNNKVIQKRNCKRCRIEFVIRRCDKIFCTRNCKNLYYYELNSNFRYGQNMVGKRCGVCSFDITLDVHHIDKNRENNNKENLMILCPTHHFMIHRGYAKIVDKKYILIDKPKPFYILNQKENITESKINKTINSNIQSCGMNV